jgi:xylulokinase
MRDARGWTMGVDVGTSSTKVVLVDADGVVRDRLRLAHKVTHADGAFFHNALSVWHRQARRAVAAMQRPGIAGIGVVGPTPSLAAVRADGAPISPGLLYGDSRGRSGTKGSSVTGEAGGFLRYLRQGHPDADGYWPVQAVVTFALCGTAAIDEGVARTLAPLSDGHAWTEDAVRYAGGVGRFPRIASRGVPVGEAGQAVVAAGGIDVSAERSVAGLRNAGEVLVICGSTLVVWAVAPTSHAAEGLRVIPHTDESVLIGTPSRAGGLFVEWVWRMTSGRGLGQPARDPEAVPVWLPYPDGERHDAFPATPRALLAGLELAHDARAVRRAAYEATAFVVRRILEHANVAATEVIMAGGGSAVPEWRQAIADCLRVPVRHRMAPEGAALGAAYSARLAAGLTESPDPTGQWLDRGSVTYPEERWINAVGRRYRRFCDLSDAASPRLGGREGAPRDCTEQ